MGVVATVTITFIIIGDINTLAPIVTMPFLLTYACIDYSYFALAQTFDLQTRREERYRIQAQSPSYETRRYGSTAAGDQDNNDLDHLFPDRTRHKIGTANSPQHEDGNSAGVQPLAAAGHAVSSDATEDQRIGRSDADGAMTAAHPDGVTFRGGSVNSINGTEDGTENNAAPSGDIGNEEEEPIAPIRPPIHSKTKNWYSSYCNRWASLLGVSIFVKIAFVEIFFK